MSVSLRTSQEIETESGKFVSRFNRTTAGRGKNVIVVNDTGEEELVVSTNISTLANTAGAGYFTKVTVNGVTKYAQVDSSVSFSDTFEDAQVKDFSPTVEVVRVATQGEADSIVAAQSDAGANGVVEDTKTYATSAFTAASAFKEEVVSPAPSNPNAPGSTVTHQYNFTNIESRINPTTGVTEYRQAVSIVDKTTGEVIQAGLGRESGFYTTNWYPDEGQLKSAVNRVVNQARANDTGESYNAGGYVVRPGFAYAQAERAYVTVDGIMVSQLSYDNFASLTTPFEATLIDVRTTIEDLANGLFSSYLTDFLEISSDLIGAYKTLDKMVENDEYLTDLISGANGVIVAISETIPPFIEMYYQIEKEIEPYILTSNDEFANSTVDVFDSVANTSEVLVSTGQQYVNDVLEINKKGVVILKSSTDDDVYEKILEGANNVGLTYDYSNYTYQQFIEEDLTLDGIEAALGYPNGSLSLYLGEEIETTANSIITFLQTKQSELSDHIVEVRDLIGNFNNRVGVEVNIVDIANTANSANT